MWRLICTVLALGVFPRASAQEAPHSFNGFSLETPRETLNTRYPNSTVVPGMAFVSAEDAKEHIFFVELSSEKVRLLFERPAELVAAMPDDPMEKLRVRHPSCEPVLDDLKTRYGIPVGQSGWEDDHAETTNYTWVSDNSQLKLSCVRPLSDKKSLAVDIVILKSDS